MFHLQFEANKQNTLSLISKKLAVGLMPWPICSILLRIGTLLEHFYLATWWKQSLYRHTRHGRPTTYHFAHVPIYWRVRLHLSAFFAHTRQSHQPPAGSPTSQKMSHRSCWEHLVKHLWKNALQNRLGNENGSCRYDICPISSTLWGLLFCLTRIKQRLQMIFDDCSTSPLRVEKWSDFWRCPAWGKHFLASSVIVQFARNGCIAKVICNDKGRV